MMLKSLWFLSLYVVNDESIRSLTDDPILKTDKILHIVAHLYVEFQFEWRWHINIWNLLPHECWEKADTEDR